jgi:hypothetical protein|tara:strand:+ start:71 stop:268 length:198 start_codon:yes stop_codon:yes gene_type:complete
MTHLAKRLSQQLRLSRNSSQMLLLAVIAALLLPLARLLLNGRKQQGYHESVLIVVRVGITVVLQR